MFNVKTKSHPYKWFFMETCEDTLCGEGATVLKIFHTDNKGSEMQLKSVWLSSHIYIYNFTGCFGVFQPAYSLFWFSVSTLFNHLSSSCRRVFSVEKL